MTPDLGEEREGMRQYYDFWIFYISCGKKDKRTRVQGHFTALRQTGKSPVRETITRLSDRGCYSLLTLRVAFVCPPKATILCSKWGDLAVI